MRTLSKRLLPGLFLVLFMAATAYSATLPDFTELAEETGKAVVNISTVKMVKGNDAMREFFQSHRPPRGQGNGPMDDFFDQFNRFFGEQQPQRPHKEGALGSGFIISDDGYIVTNYHVIAGADEIKVNLLGSDESYPAKIVGRDKETDLALLKIDAKRTLPTLTFGDSDKAKVGQWVLAIGNPFGLGHTVTAGIISAKGRIIGAGPFDNFIQTDASINPGNSGGPLIDMNGHVIGVNTAIVASGQGIGFAVPSNMVKTVIEQLKTKGKVSRGWLGVTIQDVNPDAAKALGLPEAKGAMVANVLPGQPADKAGLKTADVITKVNGEDVADSAELLRHIAALKPGQTVHLTVWRKGKSLDLTAVLGQRDTEKLAEANGGQPGQMQPEAKIDGLALRPVTEREAKALGLEKPQGLLVVDVEQDSPADQAQIAPGDVILEVNQQPVSSVADFERVYKTEGKTKGVLLLLIKRQGHNVIRTMTVPH
ncbi:protease Do [Desulfovibrio sp. X2]|uniref:DegQ family serine endoprotease n=1 Tax=Desulfovibrio sp. X2 TaxID=941449 RepID=UPI000358932C|nr:DegQ family serine endoprotease [Desulfovibrio sp. X2]EPR42479.1 protease Do [Desulfovibrio sp. X2]